MLHLSSRGDVVVPCELHHVSGGGEGLASRALGLTGGDQVPEGVVLVHDQLLVGLKYRYIQLLKTEQIAMIRGIGFPLD